MFINHELQTDRLESVHTLKLVAVKLMSKYEVIQ